MKGTRQSESQTISRNWLALGGAVPPGSARPRMSKHQKHMVDVQGTSVFCGERLPERKLMGFADALDVGDKGGEIIKDAAWPFGLSSWVPPLSSKSFFFFFF